MMSNIDFGKPRLRALLVGCRHGVVDVVRVNPSLGQYRFWQCLNLDDVSFSENCNTLHIRLLSSKTDQKHRSVILFVSKQPDSDLCPARLLQSFLKLRFSGLNGSNKLFVHFDGACLSEYQFSSVLQKCLQFCDIPLHIRSHSFRIGRATDLARFGVEDDHIKQCGR
jgi:site-specific recombinase XerD